MDIRKLPLITLAALFLSTPTFAVESQRPHVSLGGSFGILLTHQTHPGTYSYQETSPSMWNLDGELTFDGKRNFLISLTFGFDRIQRRFNGKASLQPWYSATDLHWTESIFRVGLRGSYKLAMHSRLWLGCGIAESRELRVNSRDEEFQIQRRHTGLFAEAGFGYRPFSHLEIYSQYQLLKLNNVEEELSGEPVLWLQAYSFPPPSAPDKGGMRNVNLGVRLIF